MKRKKYVGFASVAFMALLVLSLSSFNRSASANNFVADTIPSKKQMKDLDDVMKELDKAMEHLDKEMKEMDFSKIDKEIKEAMKKVDADKIKADIDKAVKEIDFTKMEADIKNGLKQIDADKIKADVEASIAKIDTEKIKKDMERVKDIDLSAIEKHLKEIKPQIEKSMEDAKKSIEKAKAEMQEYKNFVDDLDKTGLIDKDQPYTIESKNGELIINGKKQSASVYNQYRSFLEKHKNFTLKKTKDQFNIDKD